MTFEYRRIAIDAESGDDAGMLVLRDGALLAVAALLGDIHDDLAGRWYVEAIFHPRVAAPRDPFRDLDALDGWLCEQLRRQ